MSDNELVVQDTAAIARAYKEHQYLRGLPERNIVKNLKNHFYMYVNVPVNDDDCMEWQGYVNPSGYGKLMHDFKSLRANRISYQTFIGSIPDNMEVCHSCDNTMCVNPSHLFLGSHKDNMQDMANKKRHQALHGSDHPNSKLSESKVKTIKKMLADGIYQRDIAKKYGVNQSTIKEINKNRRWKHVK